jgi:GT2 family glycosyltransferase
MARRPRCAVVIPTYNGAHLLNTCLEALLANPPKDCGQEIVVVDDASSDRTPETLAAFGDRVVFVAHPVNQGFAHSCNDGAQAVESDHVVFLNNDTVPLAGWLDALVAEVEADPQVGAVGAKLLYPDGSVQHAGVAIGHDGWPHHLYAGFPGEHPAVNRPRTVVAATAACLLVRRSVFDALGGFDSAFHNGYEDIDFCLRITAAGLRVRYCPGSVLYHLESVTRWPSGRPESTEGNDRLYWARWGERVEPDDVTHFLEDGLLKLRYAPTFPLRLTVAPELAVVMRDGAGLERMDALLDRRSRQVMELLAERTRALVDGARRDHAGLISSRPRVRAREPHRLRDGGAHRIGDGEPRHLVSVLMPLKNEAPSLRELLPLVLAQAAPALIEFVAVDSGSSDDTLDVLAEFDATILAIEPADFDHGLTRNLAARNAKGDILVFLNGRSRPVGDGWLAPLLAALDKSPDVAGVCSRVTPYPDADLLSAKDGRLELSGSDRRQLKRIADWAVYQRMTTEERRVFLNFHTVSAAVRADVFARIPLRSVRTIGEDLLWAREVLERGLTLVHEPASVVHHSHSYGLRELFSRNIDDGVANRDINGRQLLEEELEGLVRGMIRDDWRHLRDELGLSGQELEDWKIESALRRVAQGAGQWVGSNHGELPEEVIATFSRIAGTRRLSD